MSKEKKYIHIHAKCNYFEIFEIVPESRSVERLIKIRNNYLWSKQHHGYFMPKIHKNKRLKTLYKHGIIPKMVDENDKLTVKTCVVNPELPFKSAIV